jgi:hypothetical protein
MPRFDVREFLELLLCRNHEQSINSFVPRSKRKISKRAFVAYEPLFSFQRAFKNTQNAPNFVFVARNCCRELLGVEVVEPRGASAGMLD